MALTAQQVMDRAAKILQDVGKDRWGDPGLLFDLNLGRSDMCVLRPDIYAQRATVTLAAGAEQAIPSTGARFLDALCNVSATGALGRAVRVVTRDWLEAIEPDWRGRSQASTVKHVIFDEQTPKLFDVYPPVRSGTKLRITHAVSPVPITNAADELAAEGDLAPALIDFLVACSLKEDSDIPQAFSRAQTHYGLYLQALGVAKRTGFLASPNFTRQAATPAKEMLTNGGS